MREDRSRSQILFGFLPDQTVDLAGRVWRVKYWQDAIRKPVDSVALGREIKRLAAAWYATGKDGNLVADLTKGRSIEVLTLNMDTGVRVEPFPNVWICKACGRVANSDRGKCRCGLRAWGQFHFVGYHECGAIREPYLPKCPTHRETKVIFPGTSSAAEIRIVCPVCQKNLRKGLGMPNCECGNGRLQYTVHRASSVYTPRSVVIVNPPSQDDIQELTQHGGPARALAWVLSGRETPTFKEMGLTRETLIQQLIDQGFTRELATTMAQQAIAAGQLEDAPSDDLASIQGPEREEAEREAVTIASAMVESRFRIEDLVEKTEDQGLGRRYRREYPEALAIAGVDTIELLDKLPVLTGNFAYTRGDSAPGSSRLVPFRTRQGNYAVFADIAPTEAFFVQLSPSVVAEWCRIRGFDLGKPNGDRSLRAALIQRALIPNPGEAPGPTLGSDLLKLVHSIAHRFIRITALHSGIEQTALAELLVPIHLGFFVYAAARGDFVLGGLQAVFETELDRLLTDVARGEFRCPLDPGCQETGGACMACLHLGEPSCRYYNSFLDRRSLWGGNGYFQLVAQTTPN